MLLPQNEEVDFEIRFEKQKECEREETFYFVQYKYERSTQHSTYEVSVSSVLGLKKSLVRYSKNIRKSDFHTTPITSEE